MKPIPISAAKHIAEKYDYDQVIIIARKVGDGGEHCTTYGRDKDNGFVFHDLRTTVKTNLLMAGVDKVLRDTLLGHTIMGMDTYYIKPSEDDLRGAIAKYTQWIDEKIAKNATQNVDQKC